MTKPTVLITAAHRGGANALAPVITRLQEDSGVSVCAIAYDVANAAWQGLEHKVLESAYGPPSFATAERVLDDVKPHIVITGTAAPDERHRESMVWDKQVVAAANKHNIPSVAVLDAWMNYGDLRFGNTETGEHWCFMPTKIAIMDNYAYKGFIDAGIPEQHKGRLVITGNPYHDTIAKAKNKFTQADRAAIRADLDLKEDVAVVFYGSSWIEPNYAEGTNHYLGFTDRSVLDELLPALAELKPVQLLINMHPAERRDNPMRYVPYLEQACGLGFDAVLFSPLPHKKIIIRTS